MQTHMISHLYKMYLTVRLIHKKLQTLFQFVKTFQIIFPSINLIFQLIVNNVGVSYQKGSLQCINLFDNKDKDRYNQHTYIPVYSGKHTVSDDFLIFSSNKSFLFRKRIIDVSVNHLLLQMESKSFRLSCMRFCNKQPNYCISPSLVSVSVAGSLM